MSALKSLTLTALPKAEHSPIQLRRSRLIERLEDQKSLLKDPAYVRIVQRWKKQDGERVLTERKLPVRPWWRTDEGAGRLLRSGRLEAAGVREGQSGRRRRHDGEAAGDHRHPDRSRSGRRAGPNAGAGEDRSTGTEEEGGLIACERDQNDISSDPSASRGKVVNGGRAFPLLHADRTFRGSRRTDEIAPERPPTRERCAEFPLECVRRLWCRSPARPLMGRRAPLKMLINICRSVRGLFGNTERKIRKGASDENPRYKYHFCVHSRFSSGFLFWRCGSDVERPCREGYA